jgi:hypothetical protein
MSGLKSGPISEATAIAIMEVEPKGTFARNSRVLYSQSFGFYRTASIARVRKPKQSPENMAAENVRRGG